MAVSNQLPARSVILSTQLVFNIGFYAVVPFIAIHMRDELLMGSTLIGIVLGVRTFSQQGMFFLGGVLAHRWGYRRLMLAGCAVRVLGYLGLAVADTTGALIISAALTGLGGAMFSPCMEALTAEIEKSAQQHQAEALAKAKPRTSLFATFAVFGELGAVAGPVLGGLLMPWGFAWVAASCAGLFVIAGAILFATVPAQLERTPQKAGNWRKIFKHKDFLLFALAYSSYLFSYNQLYMAVPSEIARINAPLITLSWLFVLASVLVISLQLPIASLCRRFSARTSLCIGFSWMTLAFLALLSSALSIVPKVFDDSYLSVIPIAFFVIFLSVGQMFAAPVAMALVPLFAKGQSLPIYYGFLASAGGAMVLVGNLMLGGVQDALAALPELADLSGLSWLVAMLLPACTTVVLARLRLPDDLCKRRG